jgi:hypothetical protein
MFGRQNQWQHGLSLVLGSHTLSQSTRMACVAHNVLGCHVLLQSTGMPCIAATSWDAMCCCKVLGCHVLLQSPGMPRVAHKVLGCHVLLQSTGMPCVAAKPWDDMCCCKVLGCHVLLQSAGVPCGRWPVLQMVGFWRGHSMHSTTGEGAMDCPRLRPHPTTPASNSDMFPSRPYATLNLTPNNPLCKCPILTSHMRASSFMKRARKPTLSLQLTSSPPSRHTLTVAPYPDSAASKRTVLCSTNGRQPQQPFSMPLVQHTSRATTKSVD